MPGLVWFSLGFLTALVVLSLLRAAQVADYEAEIGAARSRVLQLEREVEELQRQLHDFRELTQVN